jgi:hypothetical protein
VDDSPWCSCWNTGINGATVNKLLIVNKLGTHPTY